MASDAMEIRIGTAVFVTTALNSSGKRIGWDILHSYIIKLPSFSNVKKSIKLYWNCGISCYLGFSKLVSEKAIEFQG